MLPSLFVNFISEIKIIFYDSQMPEFAAEVL